ncbi:His Kinase A (phospho-acceptor) domain-containing protein [Paenibacillus sp. UNCCL117]|uniref:sensor histidine kinase n=1 Tax=unclassified Paenibacillus TaxID=185978 RepID=UPI00088A8CB3|nr:MULTISPECIES: ATP-binding protein [unclassified Paenibacillus]SDC04738.1 His Kinase A (phospho-acceptor) domain-containing protein [Paenibacillus sp. cl123]SFW37400.1 His Kinase A (phospho-acceptor) domain-containing protein [Paenibacillus sp. UNCCL117]
MRRHLNMKIIPFLLLALLLFVLALGSRQVVFSPPGPSAEAGVLDLRGWKWKQKPTVRLNGEWEFYWERLLRPADFGRDAVQEAPVFLKVPGPWNGGLVKGEEIGGRGYATYRLRVLLTRQERELAVRLPAINTSYRLWINGRPIAAAGRVGTSDLLSRPQFLPVLAGTPSGQEELELVLQVSNFDHQKGGIRQPIELGWFEAVAREKELSVAFDTLVIGSLLIMGLYQIGLFTARTKERSTLWFGIFCLIFALRMSLLGEILLIKLFPRFSWELAITLEYITSALSLPIFTAFFTSLYPKESSRRLNTVLTVGVMAYTAVIVSLPAYWFTKGLWVLQLLVALGLAHIVSVIAIAFARKRAGAAVLLVPCLLLGAAVLNDMLYAHELIQTTERMAAFALLIFVLFQSVLLSMKLSRAFVNEEKLSEELKGLNGGLQEKIRERTYDLEAANEALRISNEEMSRLEKSRSQLISNISHDLGTPLTSIQCHVEAILDGIVDTEEQREAYLRIIRDKVKSMDRLIEDLFQLSRLEAGQVEFKLKRITSDRLIEHLYRRYELDVHKAGLHYDLIVQGDAPCEGGFSTVQADLDRLHQVYGNLIYNSLKFTRPGGRILVELEDDGVELICRVSDTGEGIKEQDQPFVFDRFYTSNTSRNMRTGGKGLGLSIAKEIVEGHGGRIWIERTGPEQGTVICFSLPAEKA